MLFPMIVLLITTKVALAICNHFLHIRCRGYNVKLMQNIYTSTDVQPCITKITEANDLKQTIAFPLKMHHPAHILL